MAATIASLAGLRLPLNTALRIIVADNDDTPSAEETVRQACMRHGLDFRYVHAPARNISTARNACLDALTADWFAFIDDDEIAAPDWLAVLLGARTDADIVFGTARALYSINAPKWLTANDFHSFDPSRPKTSGSTSNVLVNRLFIERHNLRFDVALGRTGGEDTIFFYEARLRGARVVSAANALVYEPVAPERENRCWLLRRRFRSGQTHALCIARFHPNKRTWAAFLAGLKALYFSMRAFAAMTSATRRTHFLWRAVLHAGVVAYSVNPRMVLEYSRPNRLQR